VAPRATFFYAWNAGGRRAENGQACNNGRKKAQLELPYRNTTATLELDWTLIGAKKWRKWAKTGSGQDKVAVIRFSKPLKGKDDAALVKASAAWPVAGSKRSTPFRDVQFLFNALKKLRVFESLRQ